MNKTGIPYLDYTWNPGGCGCSKGCHLCWGRGECAERLHEPAARQKRTTIGVQFTGELFDPERPFWHTTAILGAARRAPRHTYVFLTQQPHGMARYLAAETEFSRPNWFAGITARDQGQLDAGMKALERIPHKIWISAEPLAGPLDFKPYMNRIWGVIIGTNNNADAIQAQPEWIASITRQCERAGICVFVKQIRTADTGRRLLTDPADEKFPRYMRIRELVWPLAGQPACRDHYRKQRGPHPGQPVHFETV